MIRSLARLVPPAAALALLAGCQSLHYDPDKLLYLSSKRAFAAGEIQAAFRETLPRDKPVVLFVHGRGDEPGKSLEGISFLSQVLDIEGRAVHKIEQTYRVPVVLFSWDSKRNAGLLNLDLRDRCRPLENSAAAAERLRRVIESLESLAAGSDRPRLVLLAHSMGTWVVKNYVEKYGAFPKGLFANVVLSSADVDNRGHTAWVQRLAETSRVYVTVNESDWILLQADSCRTPGALPLGLAPGDVRSPQAAYVVLPSMDAHEIFYRSEWEKFERVRTFYDTVLTGRAFAD